MVLIYCGSVQGEALGLPAPVQNGYNGPFPIHPLWSRTMRRNLPAILCIPGLLMAVAPATTREYRRRGPFPRFPAHLSRRMAAP